MRVKLLILGVIALFLIQIASAGILISQTKPVYNLGDSLNADITIKATENTNNFVKVNLVCDNSSELILQMPVSLASGEDKKVSVGLDISGEILNNTKGECQIEANYGNDLQKSSSFEISDYIKVDVKADKSEINPDELILITGTAIKKNSENAKGIVEVTNSELKINANTTSENGSFSLTIPVAETTKSGQYTLNIKVYEKENEKITNNGESSVVIKIRQVPKRLEIVSDESSIKGKTTLTFETLIYDQAEQEIQDNVNVIFKDNNGEEILSKLVKTKEKTTINFESNSTPGYWKIEASTSKLNSSRLIYVSENEEAEFSIIDDILTIKNIGNVPYKKPVEIDIGDKAETKQVDIGVGGDTKFKLNAPDGSYKISINDGNKNLIRENVALTGDAISVDNIREQIGLINSYPLVWMFLIAVFGMFVFIGIKKMKKSVDFTSPSIPVVSSRGFARVSAEKQEQSKIKEGDKVDFSDIIRAEHSLVLKGDKLDSAIISLKIKNSNKIDKKVIEKLRIIFRDLARKKAAVMESQDFDIIIFSPLLTKTFDNSITAIKTAIEIKGALDELNKREEKVDFGIAVHTGELVSQIEKGKLKFTPLGNSLQQAKKISDLANKDILLSQDIHKKTINEVKASRVEIGGKELFKIERISERGKYEGFVNKFQQGLKKDNEDKRRAATKIQPEEVKKQDNKQENPEDNFNRRLEKLDKESLDDSLAGMV